MKNKHHLLLAVLLGMGSYASAQTEDPFNVLDQPTRGVYGSDNRIEAKSKWAYRDYVRATAAMVDAKSINGNQVKAITLRQALQFSYGVPPGSDVQFLDQPIASGCTGFLIAPDILVSAGHCFQKRGTNGFTSTKDPNYGGHSDKVWIFDYTNDVPFNRSQNYITIPRENQYRIVEMIDAKLVGSGTSGVDYAIMRLDRPTNRKPFKFRFGGKVSTGDFLAMVGAPDGLPLKIADSAYVINNNGQNAFKTNLDAFHGNSGGPVFNVKGWIEGMLLFGPSDYYVDDACKCVRTTTYFDSYNVLRRVGLGNVNVSAADYSSYGEGVFRFPLLSFDIKVDAVLRNMDYAIRNNNAGEFAEWCMYNGIFEVQPKTRENIIPMAASWNRTAIVDTIIGICLDKKNYTGKVDLNATDNLGAAMIHYLARYNNAAAIRKASRWDDLDVKLKDRSNRNPLHYAAEYGATAALEELLKLKSDINAQDWSGETPLHYAVRSGNLDAVRVLVWNGASTSYKNNSGQTPLALAKKLKYKEIKKYLKKK
jgi:V8-like Glu-specific endopeptidase